MHPRPSRIICRLRESHTAGPLPMPALEMEPEAHGLEVDLPPEAILAAKLKERGVPTPRALVRSISAEKLRSLERRAMHSPLPPRHSLTAYWVIDLAGAPERVEETLEYVRTLEVVEHAYQAPLLVHPSATPDYLSDQGYLRAAPTGIGARWLHGKPHGRGRGARFVDIERGWNLSHEDLQGLAANVLVGTNLAADSPDSEPVNHGTAVLGVVAARANGFGVRGVAPSLGNVSLASLYTGEGEDLLDLSDVLVQLLDRHVGTIVLIEWEILDGDKHLPVENDPDVLDAIRLACALGLVVVEPAGNGAPNGGINIDLLHPLIALPVDSGAIIVSAVSPEVVKDPVLGKVHKLDIQVNFGARVDCYAWGAGIYTCGYGSAPDSPTERDRLYYEGFGQTSGAAAIIAGAAVLLQARHLADHDTPLTALQMRALLKSAGTPCMRDTVGPVGVVPDLAEIVRNHMSLSDVYVRDNLADDGVPPTADPLWASPDIWLSATAVAGDATFGHGSAKENAMPPPALKARQDRWIYVRVRNRGQLEGRNVRASVWRVAPDSIADLHAWTLLGTSAARNVPADDALYVLDPIAWEGDHQPLDAVALVAVLGGDDDDLVPLPTDDLTLDELKAWFRNNNNVARSDVTFVLNGNGLP